MEIQPMESTLGAFVTDVDLVQLDSEGFDPIYQAWLEYALLVFPGQFLSNTQQVDFARRFGEMEFDIAPLSNVRLDGSLRADDGSDDVVQILKGNMGWHHDSTYMPIQAKGAVFSAEVVPSSGGETQWADMRAAYEALPEGLKDEIRDLSAFHSLAYSQAKLGYVEPERRADDTQRDPEAYNGYGFGVEDTPLRRLVKIHPETGRPSLLIGRHAYGIPGLGEQESETLLEQLLDFACQAPRIYTHRWAPGDLVVWDNRCLLHRGNPWDMNEPRVMYHSRIKGDAESESASSVGSGSSIPGVDPGFRKGVRSS